MLFFLPGILLVLLQTRGQTPLPPSHRCSSPHRDNHTCGRNKKFAQLTLHEDLIRIQFTPKNRRES
jgi:hypothetical protein